MRKYETLLLLSPELATEERETLLAALSAVIERENGALIKADHWGMRDLAYPVEKHMRGYYVRLEYEGPAPLVHELERNIRITEGICKFTSMRLEEPKSAAKAENAEEAAQ